MAKSLELATPTATWLREDLRRPTTTDALANARYRTFKRVMSGRGAQNISALLPGMFTMKGRPLTLTEHFAMEPLYSLNLPQRFILKTARQVSKSTSLALNGILVAMLRKHTRILYCTPLFEQVRKFSQNYVGAILEESYIDNVLTGRADQNVLQRNFPNRSQMYFTYALLDADRARGTPADILACFTGDTLITMADGSHKPVVDVVPGDYVMSYDTRQKKTCVRRVSAVHANGERPTVNMTCKLGYTVRCTPSHLFWSSNGWTRITRIAENLSEHRSNGVAAPTVTRLDSGGRLPPSSDGHVERISTGSSGERAGSLHLAQIQSAGEPSVEASAHCGARQPVRRHWQALHLSNRATQLDYAVLHPMLPGPQEGRDPGMAPATHMGRDRVLVHGRRIHLHKDPRCGTLDAWIHTRGKSTDREVLSDPRGLHNLGACRAGQRKHPLERPVPGRHALQVPGRHPATCAGVHGLQTSSPTAASRAPLLDVRGTVPTTSPRWLLHQVLKGLLQSSEGRVHKQMADDEVARKHRSVKSQNATCQLQEDGETTRQPGSTRRALSAEKTDGLSTCESQVASIQPGGDCQVYDLTVEGTHCYFANGYLVHNCDEIQDLDPAHLPTLTGCLGASDLAMQRYSGTPNTSDNIINALWLQSSQAVWTTKCDCCGHWSAASLEYDLEQMIGPEGPICAKCKRPIDTTKGMWYHQWQNRISSFPGFHVPQIILPFHYRSFNKWTEILKAREGPRHAFLNEVLGETCDVGSRLVSLDDLRACSKLGLTHKFDDLAAVEAIRGEYQNVYMGIDWSLGGGGRVTTHKGRTRVVDGTASYTAISVVGFKNDPSQADLLWSCVLPSTMRPNEAVRKAIEVFIRLRCECIAHDYGGGGFVYEDIMRTCGMQDDQMMPMQYVHAPKAPLIQGESPGRDRARWSYSIDKTRSLVMTCAMIREKRVRFPVWSEEFEEKLASHFLALMETRTSSRLANDTYLIIQSANQPSDFAHSLNLALCCGWHRRGVLARMSEIYGVFTQDDQTIRMVNGPRYEDEYD